MSALGGGRPSDEDEIVLVFRPPENPAAQVVGATPFKGLRLKLDELLDWFKDLNVDSIELWIEGAWKSGKRTELFLSLEGKTGAKVTLRPFSKTAKVRPSQIKVEDSSVPENVEESAEDFQSSPSRPAQAEARSSTQTIAALFSPSGGVEREIISMIGSAARSIEMAAYAFTNEDIAKALLDAVKRGVNVSVVLDRSETKGQQASLHDQLESAGTDVRVISPAGGIMHNKFIIVDGRTVEWGSYNYTQRAEDANFENATFLSDTQLAKQYHSDFVSIFNQATPEVRGMERMIRRFFRHVARRTAEE